MLEVFHSLLCVLVLAGIELSAFRVAGTELCYGFVTKMVLISP